jgi:hypothetical protein
MILGKLIAVNYQPLSREAQLFVGWVSALRNMSGRWVSCFNPTYVHLIFNYTHLLSSFLLLSTDRTVQSDNTKV